jgi:hypothetical protein
MLCPLPIKVHVHVCSLCILKHNDAQETVHIPEIQKYGIGPTPPFRNETPFLHKGTNCQISRDVQECQNIQDFTLIPSVICRL